MTSMYNKLCSKQNGLFSNMSYLTKGQGSMNNLISSNHVCFVPTCSFSIVFYNLNHNYKGFHMLQGYFKFV